MGKIFIIMGKSATGKDTIFKRLQEEKSLDLKTVVTYTTRPIREGEKEGIEYHFVNQERFKELLSLKKIIEDREYNTIHGVWRYFTVDDGQINLDRNDYLMINTLEAYVKLCEYFGEDKVVPIYIEVDDGIRLSRALERENIQLMPKYTELCRRFITDSEDFSENNLKKAGIVKSYKNVIVEDCIQKVIKEIKKYLYINV